MKRLFSRKVLISILSVFAINMASFGFLLTPVAQAVPPRTGGSQDTSYRLNICNDIAAKIKAGTATEADRIEYQGCLPAPSTTNSQDPVAYRCAQLKIKIDAGTSTEAENTEYARCIPSTTPLDPCDKLKAKMDAGTATPIEQTTYSQRCESTPPPSTDPCYQLRAKIDAGTASSVDQMIYSKRCAPKTPVDPCAQLKAKIDRGTASDVDKTTYSKRCEPTPPPVNDPCDKLKAKMDAGTANATEKMIYSKRCEPTPPPANDPCAQLKAKMDAGTASATEKMIYSKRCEPVPPTVQIDPCDELRVKVDLDSATTTERVIFSSVCTPSPCIELKKMIDAGTASNIDVLVYNRFCGQCCCCCGPKNPNGGTTNGISVPSGDSSVNPQEPSKPILPGSGNPGLDLGGNQPNSQGIKALIGYVHADPKVLYLGGNGKIMIDWKIIQQLNGFTGKEKLKVTIRKNGATEDSFVYNSDLFDPNGAIPLNVQWDGSDMNKPGEAVTGTFRAFVTLSLEDGTVLATRGSTFFAIHGPKQQVVQGLNPNK